MATRVGGSRDALLGGWLLLSPNSGERNRLLAALAFADTLDTLSAIVCFAEGNLPLETAKAAAIVSGSLATLELLARH
ncbi:hypothetical protein VE00_10084 [Pseudogymnoascus sp. WSF 3629]|nr:hypothetical protein VE00_10084 [Pseudogymnoascus sp. WSF 3629]